MKAGPPTKPVARLHACANVGAERARKDSRWLDSLGLLLAVVVLTGCGTTFPQPTHDQEFADNLTADELLARSIEAHGGDMRAFEGDINLATDGEWQRLIQRIQPIVTDTGYRQAAEQRYKPAAGVYGIRYTGPEGVKTIFRRDDEITVYYDGERTDDPERIAATAMTTDAYELFQFGPSFIQDRAIDLARLPDQRESGVDYRRVFATLRPGFGLAEEDEVVAWFHPDTDLLYRVHLTLTGFEATEGAHVDTTFEAYEQVGPFTLPSELSERVRGPIRIGVLDWWVTGHDVDRGWTEEDLRGPEFSGAAEPPAGEPHDDE